MIDRRTALKGAFAGSLALSAGIARAQCRPEECFYTDDIAEYVEGARKQGIDAVQFLSGEQLQRELTARDVRWS